MKKVKSIQRQIRRKTMRIAYDSVTKSNFLERKTSRGVWIRYEGS